MAKSTKVKKPTTKKVADKSVKSETKRAISKPKYKTLRLSKKLKSSQKKPISGSFRILKASLKHIYRNKKLFMGIVAIYFVISLVFVSGLLAGNDYAELKSTIQEISGGSDQLTTGLSLFGVLLSGNTGSDSQTGGIYQTLLIVIISLVVIWALRHTYAKEKISIKQTFYNSTYPLIPFVLVIFVILLQTLPLIMGSSIYGVVISRGLAVTVAEKVLWIMLVFLLGLLTLYMVTSSIFALYIVTLPDLTPMKALRSARELVQHRRWMVMRKVLFLPIALIVLAAIIMIPVLLYLTAIAQLFFVILSMIGLIVAHSYMYKLYRELL